MSNKKGQVTYFNFKANNEASNINIAILGDRECGKSSLVECFLDKQVQESSIDTIIKIHQVNQTLGSFNINFNFFDLSGNINRDKEIILKYLNIADIVVLCHSLVNDFDENSQIGWLNLIKENSIKGKNNIFMIGTKLDLKAELDYQKGISSSTLTFSNGNLSSSGLKIKNFLMSHSIKEYFMVSSVLNYNVNECFESIFKEFLAFKSKEVSISDKDLQNCILF